MGQQRQNSPMEATPSLKVPQQIGRYSVPLRMSHVSPMSGPVIGQGLHVYGSEYYEPHWSVSIQSTF